MSAIIPAPFPFFHAYDSAERRLTLRGAGYIPEAAIAFMRDRKIRILDASDGTLTALPESFGTLDQLEIAFFSNNMFTAFPPELMGCRRLSMVSFKGCRIAEISDGVLPSSLRWLVLTGNGLKSLPGDIARCGSLEKLALAGNALAALPDGMQALSKLGLLRLSANAFETAPPDWVFGLPVLGWYSDAGNGFSTQAVADRLPVLAWHELVLEQKIGESPSSEVYRARLPDGDVIAAKLFRGALTSDGYPADDMRASIAAGQHPHLMQVTARLLGLPDGRDGLALRLVPPHFTRLGFPPDFDSCTRDTYPLNAMFSLPFIARVLRGVAEACVHLHKRGLMHGDIYAHNIMADADGFALLGDYGAASLYSGGTQREKLDVRGFGCLMDDLLQRADDAARGDHAFAALNTLATMCMGAPGARPLFRDVSHALLSSTRHVPPPQPHQR